MSLMDLLTSLSNCSNLLWLDMGINGFKSLLPDSIANLSTTITWLTLDSNYIFGSIPLGIGNLVNLRTLYLSTNMLVGSIPNSIGKLSNLEKLLLQTNYISGEIPSSIGNITRLGILDLSINMIEGSIPVSLGHCTNLREFNLGDNHLTGDVPQEIFGLSSLTILILSQNYLTGFLPQDVGKLKNLERLEISENKLFGQIPATLSHCQVLEFLSMMGNLFEVCISAIIYRIRRSRQQASATPPLQNQLLQLSYGEIFHATNRFSSTNLIGQGRYGLVYKGILKFGELIVAVKVLKLHECGAIKSFKTECEALKNIHHCNLVKVITSCSSIDFKGNDFKALVFEFMKNGSLENWLHPNSFSDQQDPNHLTFVQRLNIAIDVASTLDYLHHHCEVAIVHCDLKPRKRPTDNMFIDNINLHIYAKRSLSDQVMEIVDRRIILAEEEEPSRTRQSRTNSISKLEVCLALVIQIGVSCYVELPHERMNARDVLMELQKIRNVFLGFREQN
ncbi:hypothetical protein ACSBR2_040637 [Camellia fascicularis]